MFLPPYSKSLQDAFAPLDLSAAETLAKGTTEACVCVCLGARLAAGEDETTPVKARISHGREGSIP